MKTWIVCALVVLAAAVMAPAARALQSDFSTVSNAANRSVSGLGQDLSASVTDGGAPLVLTFTDLVGRVDSEAHLFDIDLQSFPRTSTFGLTVDISNRPAGWTTLNLELAMTQGACGAATLALQSGLVSPGAGASFPVLHGGQRYCVAIPAGSGELVAQSSVTAPAFTANLTAH